MRSTKRIENIAIKAAGNIAALVAAGIGALFSSILPNFTDLLPSWWGVYGWFFGVAIAGAYYLLSQRATSTVAQKA